MGTDYRESPPLPPDRVLTEAEQARVLDELHRLETEAMFTPEWAALEADLQTWFWRARLGRLPCSEVPRMAAAFERYGVG